jgi:hypothetical protein
MGSLMRTGSTTGPVADVFFALGKSLQFPNSYSVPSYSKHRGELLVNGDPQIGTVHFLRQTHTICQETPEQLRALGAEQLEIANLIKEIGTKTVFVEGLYKDLARDTPEHKEEFCEYVKWILPNYLRERMGEEGCISYFQRLHSESTELGTPSDEFLEFLGATSGPFYVLALNEEMCLKKTVSQAVDEILYRWQRQELYGSETNSKIRLELRERIAAREIREYLKHSPGDEVALLLGATHTFTDGFLKSFDDNLPLLIGSNQEVGEPGTGEPSCW